MASNPLPRCPHLARFLAVASPSLILASHSYAGANGDAVIAAEKARDAALLAGDAVAVANILSDDLRYIHTNGYHETKRMVVDALAEKKLAYERLDASDVVADEVRPDVVVLTGKLDQRKLSNGHWGDLKMLFQAVWRNESGTWRLVNLQTVLPPPPAS